MSIGFAYLPENECQPLKSLADIAKLWPRDDVHLWIDLEAPDEDLVLQIGQIFGLDELALDDCLRGEQTPRVDEFDDYIFLVLYGLHGLKEQEDLDPHKLVAFCGSRFLITIVRQPLLSIRQVRARCGRHPESLLTKGVDVVLYEIIDTIVDYYLRVADIYEDRLESLEEQSFENDVDEEILEQAADVRRDLLELRKLAVAQRQLLFPLAKGEFDFISESLSQQFSQVRDHLSQVSDTVDSMRETIVNIRANYHTSLTRRMNEIMKVLTVFAAIILPMTLIAGIYGMNLPLWPPSNQAWSFGAVMAIMISIGGGMLYYFRRRKWL